MTEIQLIKAGYKVRCVEATKYRATYVAQNLLKNVTQFIIKKTVHGYEVWTK